MLCGQNLSAADPRINEFMAVNKTSLVDEDGDHSDWIEIYNPGTTPFNLDGWFLSNRSTNLTQWRFPNITLPPDRYVLLFASGKNRTLVGQPLHTSFKLNEAGEFLALIRPDGSTTSHSFDPFPPQREDVSYGFSLNTTDAVLLAEGSPAKAFIPPSGNLGLNWKNAVFNDGGWLTGTTGVGYDYGAEVGLDVGNMRNTNETVYARVPFALADPSLYEFYTLRLKYEDGVIVYLNGTEVYRDNAPVSADWQSGAPLNRADAIALQFFDIDITPFRNNLVVGNNVFAFHGLNNGVGSSDLLISPQLVGRTYANGSPSAVFFPEPTPRTINGNGYAQLAGEVTISRPGQTFTTSLQFSLSQVTLVQGAQVRYTLNGDEPNDTSALYTGPVTVSASSYIRARVIEPGKGPGPVTGAAFIKLAPDITSFTSNLPVIVIDNFGRGGFSGDPQKESVISFFDPVNGRTSPTNMPGIVTRAGIKTRGSSTGGQPKPNLAVEAWDELNRDVDIEPFGMSKEADWVLYAPFNFDPSLMNNPLMYELSNQLGRYAVRTKFVEVFINTDGGDVGMGDYYGVYVFMEKVDREGDRVNIDRLLPEQTLQPEISGGYMLKIDRADPGDNGFYAANQSIRYVYPGETDILLPERDAQEQFIRGYFADFGTALYGSSYANPLTGYATHLDVNAAIDHHLLNVLSFNVDALRLSAFMHKPRGGKITFGPIWDFDRALGSTDGRDSNPLVWRSESGDGGTDFFNYTWWNRLFTDLEFYQRYIDRWQELRRTTFSTGNINNVVDTFAAELAEAQPRERTRWGINPRDGSYAGEIALKKQWLLNRIQFMESQFVAPPSMNAASGRVNVGFQLQLTQPGPGALYFTLDGSDPRLPGGAVSPTAFPYSGPITINSTAEVRARVFHSGHTSLTGPNNPPLTSRWSGILSARLTVVPTANTTSLAVTEINYHPAPPTAAELLSNPLLTEDDFEFLELKNISANTIDLVGATFTDGITFQFTTNAPMTLNAGGRLLLVKNVNAFNLRYAASQLIAGQYSGSLNNNGERIALVDFAGATILDFSFEDGWNRLTDGLGFSLQLRYEDVPGNPLSHSAIWRGSAAALGSPGADDGVPQLEGPVVINEVLAHTDLPQVDTIELRNLSDQSVNIGYWWLTDSLDQPRKYQFSTGTTIPANGYLLVDESNFNADPQSTNSFRLSSLGDEVWLLSANSIGDLTGHLHGLSFGANLNGITLGRIANSVGKERLVRQFSSTLPGENSAVATGPIVISEIMHFPPDANGVGNNRDEFIELRNITASPVNLFDPGHLTNTWQIADGVNYTFPQGTTIPANGHLLIVSFNPVSDTASLAAFRSAYSLTGNETILGPFNGKLNNAEERVTLLMPDRPQQAPAENPGFVPMIETDSVRYGDGFLWTTNANGSGRSLQRLSVTDHADEPLNWIAASPTPGSFNGWTSMDSDNDGLPTAWEILFGLNPDSNTGINGATGDPDLDGLSNLDEWRAHTNPNDETDYLRLSPVIQSSGLVRLQFTAAVGKRYLLQSTDNLAVSNWTTIQHVPAASRSVRVEMIVPETAGASFFRIISPPY